MGKDVLVDLSDGFLHLDSSEEGEPSTQYDNKQNTPCKSSEGQVSVLHSPVLGLRTVVIPSGTERAFGLRMARASFNKNKTYIRYPHTASSYRLPTLSVHPSVCMSFPCNSQRSRKLLLLRAKRIEKKIPEERLASKLSYPTKRHTCVIFIRKILLQKKYSVGVSLCA